VFDTLEERYAHDLGTGRAGKILYDALHSAVRDADVLSARDLGIQSLHVYRRIRIDAAPE
jgi:hypothetical protein